MTSPDSCYILSLNSGSSSLKISLYSYHPSQTGNVSEPVSLVLTSSLSNISAPPAQFSFYLANPTNDASANRKKESLGDAITNHESAFLHFLEQLETQTSINRSHITYICHRVVHGGGYKQSIIIDYESFHHIEALSDLAPLYVNFSILDVSPPH
jgi:acetate kinase